MVKKRKLRAGELGKYFVIFILPALIIYLLFSITPFLYTIYYSFTDYTDMNPINLHFVGLKNYIKVLQTPVMLAAIKNSVIYAILLTGFQTLLGLPLAFVQIPLHRITDSASNGSVFPVVTEHFSASSDHAFL